MFGMKRVKTDDGERTGRRADEDVTRNAGREETLFFTITLVETTRIRKINLITLFRIYGSK
jgi:hypothetical protein